MDQVSPVKGRWWLWLLAVLFAIVILFILLLPTLLSTESGKRFLISKVEENTKGKLTIKTLSLGWFKDQVIEDFSYTDGSGSNVEIKKVTSTASFWNLLFRRGSLGKTSIETLTANLKPFEAAKPGPSSGKSSAPKKKKKGAWKDFRGHFILTNGSVFLPSGDSLQKMNLEIDLPKTDILSFLSFNGETSGGTFSATGALKETFVGKGSFERFPTAPIDSLIALIKPEYEGLIVAAIGNTFNG
ncbi:MAG: hypothetical protein KDK63_05525, partial [Chlamydiia bacterium]|nr:hypothetical protein [Chlamydiia bacterium]